MGLVDIVFSSFLGNEEHSFEEEEAASVLGPQDMKGAFQHQLSIGGQVKTLPIDQKRLYLLQMHMAAQPTHTLMLCPFTEREKKIRYIKTHELRKPGT